VVNFGASNRSKTFRILRIPLILAVLAFAGYLWHEKTEAYHFVTVTPGILYRSGWMKPHGMNKIINKYNIRTIVNLCLPLEETYLKNNNYLEEQEICQKNGVNLVNLPMPGNTPPTWEQVDEWLSLFKDSSRLPVLVHCAQGVTRTGVMAAVYEMEILHKSNEETLKQLQMFGHKLYIPKRKRILDFVLNYRPGMHVNLTAENEKKAVDKL
jgi:protein tyrosine/serine phosphatase